MSHSSTPFVPVWFRQGRGLVQVLALYGKVKSSNHDTFKDFPSILGKTASSKYELMKETGCPTFHVSLDVGPLLATMEFVKSTAGGIEGHLLTQCKEDYCERCSYFDRTTDAFSTAHRRRV